LKESILSIEEPENPQIREEHFADLPKIMKGASVNLFGTVIGKALYLLYAVFLARVLGAHDLGIYFLGLGIVFFLGVVGNLGLNSATVRYTALYNARNDLQRLKGITIAAPSLSLLIGAALTMIVFFFADVAAARIFHKPELGNILKILSLSLPFECSMRVLLATTQGLKLMTYTAFTENVLWVGARFGFTLILVLGFDMGVKGTAWAYILSSVVCAGAAFYFATRHIPLFSKAVSSIFEYKEIMKFSIPMAFSETVYNLMAQADVLMLGFFATAANIGIYSVALRIVVMAQIVFNIFMPVFNPFISELYDRKKLDRLAALLKAITRWNVIASFPIFMSILCFPALFLGIFGEGFLEASSCLVILAVARIFTAPSILPNSMLSMAGRPDLQLVNNAGMLVLTIILNFILIPAYGITGAAAATGTCLVVVSAVRIIEVYRLMGIHPFTRDLVKPVIGGMAAFMVSYGMQLAIGSTLYFVNIGILTAFYVIYGFIIWYMKFSEEDIFVKTIIINKLAALGRVFH
jgi:O-antigen/teichoic acid export membrane protein